MPNPFSCDFYILNFDEIFDNCYQEARKAASLETSLPLNTFPTDCPYTHADVLEINFENYRIEN